MDAVCYRPIAEIVEEALRHIPRVTFLPDTNIFFPAAVASFPFGARFRSLQTTQENRSHLEFIVSFLNNHEVKIAPSIFSEVFRKKKKKPIKHYHSRVKGQEAKDGLRVAQYKGPKNAFKQRRIQLAPEGTLCEDHMIDLAGYQYKKSERIFDNYAHEKLSLGDRELGILATYYNHFIQPSMVLTFDTYLASSVSAAWKSISKENLKLDEQDIRTLPIFNPGVNLFDYLN